MFLKLFNKNHFRIYLNIILIIFLTNKLFGQTSEYDIKAVYFENFSRFIEWPNTSEIEDTGRVFILAVIGDNPFNSKLEKIYKNNKIRNKKVRIKYIKSVDEISACHMLFVGTSVKNQLAQIFTWAYKNNVVTIADSPGFGEKGVLINFYLENGKVLFEINYDAVRKSNIHISYLLLKLARIIGVGNNALK